MSDATKWMLLGAVLAVGVRMGRARGGPRLLVRPLASPAGAPDGAVARAGQRAVTGSC